MVDTLEPLGILPLFATMALISAVPGPVDFAVIGRSISHGFRPALWFVGGVLLAEIVLVGGAVYGLSALVADYGTIYLVVIWLSAGLLLFMGVQSWRSASRISGSETVAVSPPESGVGSQLAGLATGFLMTAGDPKAILFYMALLPAFVDLSTINTTVFLKVLGCALTAVALVKVTYAFAAVRAMSFFSAPGIRRGFQRSAGALLIATGLFLVIRVLVG